MNFGVCYYPEQWPRSLWADDAKRMAELGITHVRIAEFAWSRIEPRDGEYDWAWLDEAVATLANAGLKIILGTPTAAPPTWLTDRHPDMLAVRADGVRFNSGSRRHYDISHAGFRAAGLKITEAMARRYGRHAAVVAWQTDNELACHDTVPTYSATALQRFHAWLRRRYETIDALNDAWGTVFWSMTYASFDAIRLPNLTPTDANPIHLLDFRRFMSDEVASFHREQVDVLRRHAPDADVLHNFMGFFTTFDHYRFAADDSIDVAAWDSYPLARTETIGIAEEQKARYARTAHPDVSAFDHDRYRGVGRGRFWVMEQQAGPVNWAAWNPVPAAGMIRLWAFEAFAHGAELVSYFRWRQCPFAQEQMHSGLHLPDGQLSPGGRELQRAAEEIAASSQLSTLPAKATSPAAVALVFDYETQWMFEIQRHGRTFDYQMLAFDYYEVLREMGVDVDIVPATADLSRYKLVVVPSIAVVTDALVAQIEQSTAQWVFGPRSGSKTDGFAIPGNLPPGPLQKVLPMQVLEVESLRPTLKPATAFDDTEGIAVHWREHLSVANATRIDARFEDGWPAIVGSGKVRYVAAWLDHALHRALLRRAAHDAGVAVHALADGIRLRRRGNVMFAFNFGDAPADVPAPANASFVLGGPQIATGDVAAWVAD